MLSDCVLLEDFPSHYLAHTRRLERWVRGDWQLLPWLGWRVPAASGGTRRNCLPLIARWRILDNLRRSVLAPTLVVALLAVWFLVPTLALPWTIAAVCIPGIPALLDVWSRVWGFATRWLRKSAPEEPDPLRPALAFWLCEVAFLPHVAAVVCAAIARTAVRVYATHRNLLQWTTAAHTARALSNSDSAAPLWREMAAAPALAVVTAIALAAFHPQVLAIAAPLLLLWLGAAGLAHYLSRPPPSDAPALQHDDLVRLRILARRTWAFFETFVGPADQWLPPDHFQEEPRGAPARRTSPTNIGLLQVSVLGALDFGYRGVLATALQLKNTFDTLDRLERHRGHFLNWYGTADLVPLEPRYVSTVDSGNLAACLLTVKQGCLEQLNRPVVPSQLWGGYLDTLAVVRQLVESSIGKAHRAAFPALQLIDRIEEYVEQIQPTPTEWRIATARLLEQHMPTLDRHVMTLFGDEPARFDPLALSDLRGWLITLKEHLERMQREMDLLLPWLEAWRRVPASLRDAVPAELDSVWRELEALVCTVPSVVDLPVAVGRARAALSLLRSHFSPAPLRAESGASAMPSGRITSAGSAGEDRLPPEAPLQTTASLAQEPDAATWIARLETALTSAAQAADYLCARLEEGAARSEAFARAMDFGFLYDRPRHLFYIGYNVSAGRLDEHHYDLLASEARLTSFLAIAGNVVPEEHWIHLGRPIGQVAGTRALLSWSGTMFEYLMPALLLREGEQTLIGHSCAAAVREQIAYAKRHGIPWGISECGYYQFDVQQNYQYRAFGVPGLGFKRGLDEDLVVAPYASLLALPLMPREVVANLRHFSELGMIGRYGLYEAIDFTPNRRSAGDPPPIVRSFMAHHQGMVLAALNNFLNGDALIRRFHAEPMSKTAELLLYERLPRRAPVEQPQLERSRTTRPVRRISITPWSPPLDAPFPQAHVLSNGRLSVVTTDAGGGGSRWCGLALTRWSADTTLDDDGFRIYLQDQADGRVWMAFRDAAAAEPGSRRVLFAPHAVEYHARYGGLTARQRVFVAPDADVEIRHLTLSGEGRRRSITVVGFGEVVLGDGAADQRHPAFSKLFVESEYLEEDRALVYHRRPRAPDERPQYLVHMLALPRAGARLLGYDSARAAFMRARRHQRPPARSPSGLPAVARRARRSSSHDPAATIDPATHRARELAFITAVADSRDAALELARRYRSLGDLDWTYELAGHRAEEELLERGLEPAALPALTSLLSLLLYPHPALRAAPDLLARNTGGRSMLWRHALSGDLPILLVNVGHAAHTPLLPVLLRAHALWYDRGVATDLVIVNQHASSYDAHVDDQILRAIADAGVQARIHRPGGGIFLLQADQLTEDERTALNSAARVVLDGAADNLADQLAGQFTPPAALPPLVVTTADADPSPALTRPTDLLFDNGYGGFSADGEEYVIHLERGDNTPAPWVNVVANPRCGFVVSERGGGYTWVGNSGENRLTPWSNDPVSDTPGECIYVRDEESGAVWSPTPGPAWGGAAYEIRHGVGYSVFAHRCRELVPRAVSCQTTRSRSVSCRSRTPPIARAA